MGIGVMAYSPLAGGLLSGRALNPEQGSRGAQERGAAELYRVKLEAFGVLCRELGESEANVALAWTLAHPAVNCVVIGPRKVEQVTNALRAVEIALDDGTMARLNELFPGPGGEAPEAYAW